MKKKKKKKKKACPYCFGDGCDFDSERLCSWCKGTGRSDPPTKKEAAHYAAVTRLDQAVSMIIEEG